jgi:cytochrome c
MAYIIYILNFMILILRTASNSVNKILSLTFICVLAISCDKAAVDTTKPEDNRFTTTVLTQPGQLDEPMEFTFTDEDHLLFVERKGNVKSFNVKTREIKILTTIQVNTRYTSKEGDVREAEEGLMGIIADPDFTQNHWIYMYYADPIEKKHVLARWDVQGDTIYAEAKKILLEIPTQREVCCHTGGGMVFDLDGNLFLTTGNNTANPTQGTSALDERPERSSWDDQRTAGNTNDLRGKILRIHPEEDGTYTIPDGNLFPKGTEKTRPEIYTMGHRNPWRISIDNETGFIYWGEVGPDASRDSTIGPRGYDEFNQAKKPGFFGWPYFIADNRPYADYDYATNTIGEKFNTENPINNSPNNTGLEVLPKPEKAFIWYPYSNSEEFPLVGSAGRSATGGPVYRLSDFKKSDKRFPAYYEGKWLMVEFMRGWIMLVTMNKEGNYESMEKFLPEENFSSAIDMKFSPDGSLYVLEYGSAWFRGNINAQIKRIEYNGGNRKPIVKATADRYAGALPFSVRLSSAGTIDYDKDELKYEWNVKSKAGYDKTFSEPNPELILNDAGVYAVTLTVIDSHQESSTYAFELRAGNDPPVVDVQIVKGNKTFFFPDGKISYEVSVSDKEDGSLANGKIQANEVAINFDYAPEGFDPIEIAQNHRATEAWASFSRGANLIAKSDCKSCHMIDKKSVGPSYQDVAARYKNNAAGQALVAKKIITGGSGVWGDHAMSAHPQISEEDAQLMVQYIMTLNDEQKSLKTLATQGTLSETIPAADNGKGGYLLRAAYTDKGTPELGMLTAEKIIALRNQSVNPEKADVQKGTNLTTTPGRTFNIVGDQAQLGFRNIDLSGIKQIDLLVQAQPRVGSVGGMIEVHLDSPDGKLIGKSDWISPKEIDFRAALQRANAARSTGNNGQPTAPVSMAAIRRMMAITARATIEPIDGPHDVYLVFRNANAKPEQILIQVDEIIFQNRVAINKK